LQDLVYESIENDFGQVEEALALVASRPVASLVNTKDQVTLSAADIFNAIRLSVDLFEGFLTKLATPKMLEISVSFLVDQLGSSAVKSDSEAVRALHNNWVGDRGGGMITKGLNHDDETLLCQFCF